MTIEALLANLYHVKQTGPDRWIARCPAHDDKSPSLSIREFGDGRILVHDFAGCSVEDVLSAVGLTFDALFPPREPPVEGHKPERRPFLPTDVFLIARHELAVASVIANMMFNTKTVSNSDYARLRVAVERMEDISSAAYGK